MHSPSVNTVPRGGQITVPHGGQIIGHSVSQHSTTWRSDHRAFRQLTQYHMAVRSSRIPPVCTVSHGGQIIVHSTSHTAPHGSQIIVHSVSQHSTTWRSDQRVFHQSVNTWQSDGRLGNSKREKGGSLYENNVCIKRRLPKRRPRLT